MSESDEKADPAAEDTSKEEGGSAEKAPEETPEESTAAAPEASTEGGEAKSDEKPSDSEKSSSDDAPNDDEALDIDGTKSILIVEDTAAVRRIVVKFLEKDNYKALQAQDGREALKIVSSGRHQIDMILLDIMMPVMDGISFLKKLRTIEKYQKIPVAMLTSKSERDVVLDCLRAGANDFIIKPFTYDVISDKVSKTIGASVPQGEKVAQHTEVQKINFEKAKTPREKIDVLILRVRTLLALPFAVVKIAQLCTKEDTSAKDLEGPIMSDPAVAAVVLARANSTAYRGNDKADTIQKAVTRIGLKETRNIAVTFSVVKLFSREDNPSGFGKMDFWLHSLGTALSAQMIGKLLKHPQAEDGFLTGLLHDIGKMIMDDYMPNEFSKALKQVEIQRLLLRQGEVRVFEVNHAYLGGMVAERWGFPKPVVEVILDHHKAERFAEVPDELPVTALVAMGNQFAKALKMGCGGDNFVEEELMGLWSKFEGQAIDWKEEISKLYKEMVEFVELLGVDKATIDLEMPEEDKGVVAYFHPKSEGKDFSLLLTYVFPRYGYELKRYATLDELKGGGDHVAIIADLREIEEAEIDEQRAALEGLSEKMILLSVSDKVEDALKNPLEIHKLIEKVIA